MEYENFNQAIQYLTDHILTPVVYMNDLSNEVHFVCFCDRNITVGEVFKTEQALQYLLDKQVRIIDIRELTMTERIEMVHTFQIVFAENDAVESIFIQSTFEDYQLAVRTKKELLDRKQNCNSMHIQ